MAKVTNYITQQYMQSLQQQRQQQQQQPQQQLPRTPQAAAISNNKPVTVRSVKRRDKAKTEEKQNNFRTQQQFGTQQHMLNSNMLHREDEEEQAVMV